MAPLLFLVATTLVVHFAGRLFAPRWQPWPVAVRAGVAVMFTVTGISHFIGMRAQLIEMVPPVLPAPAALVTITGLLELAGAIGLVWAPTRLWAAVGLSLMLIAIFPANVHLALNAAHLPWDDTLVPRTVLQVVFLAATSAVVVWELRGRRRREVADVATAGSQ